MVGMYVVDSKEPLDLVERISGSLSSLQLMPRPLGWKVHTSLHMQIPTTALYTIILRLGFLATPRQLGWEQYRQRSWRS